MRWREHILLKPFRGKTAAFWYIRWLINKGYKCTAYIRGKIGLGRGAEFSIIVLSNIKVEVKNLASLFFQHQTRVSHDCIWMPKITVNPAVAVI